MYVSIYKTPLAAYRPLLDIYDQALEVLALGVVDVYRVVGRLRELPNDAHLAVCYGRSRKYRRAEELTADGLRA